MARKQPLTPPSNCPLCPRLVKFREQNRALYPAWHNSPVESFGTLASELLIVGLAPGLRGANRTGRVFTGDFAGDLLFDTLLKFGFATGKYLADANDKLQLKNCRIANAVRCVPPKNKPVAAEITACSQFIDSEVSSMNNLKVLLALGRIAHDTVVKLFGLPRSSLKFGHNSIHDLEQKAILIDSYHCSRYNTNTGRLSEQMFENVFLNIRTIIKN